MNDWILWVVQYCRSVFLRASVCVCVRAPCVFVCVWSREGGKCVRERGEKNLKGGFTALKPLAASSSLRYSIFSSSSRPPLVLVSLRPSLILYIPRHSVAFHPCYLSEQKGAEMNPLSCRIYPQSKRLRKRLFLYCVFQWRGRAFVSTSPAQTLGL